MATTPATTSGLAAVALGSLSLDVLQRSFEIAESPFTQSVVSLDMAAVAAGNTAADSVLSAPGAGKSLYIWAAHAFAGDSDTPGGHILLCDGGTTLVASVALSFAQLPVAGNGSLNAPAGLVPIRFLMTANTILRAVNMCSATLLASVARVRVLYCVV